MVYIMIDIMVKLMIELVVDIKVDTVADIMVDIMVNIVEFKFADIIVGHEIPWNFQIVDNFVAYIEAFVTTFKGMRT